MSKYPYTAEEEELHADVQMIEAAERAGKDKCLRIGCMVMIDKRNNPTGLCRFHSKKGS